MTARRGFPEAEEELLRAVLPTGGLLGLMVRLVSPVFSSHLLPPLPLLSLLPLAGHWLLAAVSTHLRNEDEEDNGRGVLKINSIVLKALSDAQVRAWVYRKSKYNYYENVQYCSE